MNRQENSDFAAWAPEDEPLTFSDVSAVLGNYRRAIFITLALVVLGWMIVSISLMLFFPTRRIVSLPFRLEFKGAERGQYPNGTRFQTSEILSAPVVLSVYRQNGIAEFMTFDRFRNSLFVLEQNEELEKLIREYRARLADPKLPAVDRERIEQEFAEKRASLSQASYTILLSAPVETKTIPRVTQAKVLNDILATWAGQTVQNKGVVLYDLSILSSAVFERSTLESYDYIITLDMLRSKINRVVANIDELLQIPGAKVVRTKVPSRTSLAEIRVKLQDMLNFRIQPLAGLVLAKGISKDPTASIQFLETRLRFNELEQNEEERRTEAIRESLTAYLQQTSNPEPSLTQAPPVGSGTTVIPQFGESFLDRIMDMSSEGNDLEYRQGLVDLLRQQSLAVVPLQTEAEYYRQLLESLRGFESRARPPLDSEIDLIRTQIEEAVKGAIDATNDVNEIYMEVSKNLNPSTVLFSLTEPPTFKVERSVPLSRVLLAGLLVLLISIPLAILGALIHARMSAGGRIPRKNSSSEDPRPRLPTPENQREIVVG